MKQVLKVYPFAQFAILSAFMKTLNIFQFCINGKQLCHHFPTTNSCCVFVVIVFRTTNLFAVNQEIWRSSSDLKVPSYKLMSSIIYGVFYLTRIFKSRKKMCHRILFCIIQDFVLFRTLGVAFLHMRRYTFEYSKLKSDYTTGYAYENI